MRRCCWRLIGVILFLPAAHAAEFQLRDNSLVVGKILRLTDGKDLLVDTAHMGAVTLEWDAVERIDQTHIVEVEFFDGNRMLGTITLENEILTVSGDETVKTDPATVYAISEVKFAFWDALERYLDMGINLVRGNSRVTQLSFGAGIDYDVPDFEIRVDAKTFINEQVADQDTRRTTLSTDYTKNIVRNWSVIGLYQFEADEQQNLDSRSVLGAAVGRRVINNRVQRLELFTGLAFNSEDFTQAANQKSSELLLGMRYRLRSAADIDTALIFFGNLEQTDRQRVQFDASLNVDLIGELDLNVTVYDRYDSEPPPGNDSNDYGLVLGLRWSD